MQTTLLGIAIALILALLAALIGPAVVDWNRFRPSIEAEASRLIGAPVRISGPIEATLLPSPGLTLRGLEVGPPQASSLRMRSLGVELQLGAMMRGEWRASELRLAGPEFQLGIDGSGGLALPPLTPGFDPERLSVEKLNIEDGRAVLTDSRSGSRTVLDKLWFNGDLRSLLGPFKGDGAFVVAGDLYAYRIAAGRAEEGALKLRLNIDPVEKPLAAEAEGMLSLAGTSPRFDGSVTFSRPAGIALRTGKTVSSEPWRLTSKIKATAAAALFEGLEFQYGPEERGLRLNGTAELRFGDRPRFEGILAASQMDLDRAFASPDTGRQLPLAALKTLGESFSGVLRPSIPARIGVSLDALTLAGANLQTLRGDFRSDGDAWNLEGFEFRAPGLTHVRLSGRLDLGAGKTGFSGPVSVDSADPTALVAWLEGTSTQSATRMKPLRARGEVTLGSERIAIERLAAEIDRKSVEGRFVYVWAAGDKPARLDADLNAAELDVDALLSFADAARGATTFETPREVTLGLGFGRAVVAGVEALNINARFRRDGSGLHIERLAVGDFGGNSLNASGRIDTTASPPQGALTVRLDARNLAAIVRPTERFLPEAADWVRQLAQRMPSSQLKADLALEQSGAAKLALDGRSGDMRISLRAESAQGAQAASDPHSLAATQMRLEAKMESANSSTLLDFLKLGNLIAGDVRRPGEIAISAEGSLKNLALDARLRSGGIDASAKGTLQLAADAPKADLRLALAADARPFRRGAARQAEPLPVNVSGQLAMVGSTIKLDGFSGTVAGVPAKGKAAIVWTDKPRIDAEIEADSLDAAAVTAALIGLPTTSDGRGWSSEPFVGGVLDGMEGTVAWRSGRAAVTPTLTLQQARGRLKLGAGEVAFTDVEGRIADGEFKGQLVLQKRPEGIGADARLRLSNADAAVLLGNNGKSAVTGRLALQMDLEGAGLSPQALLGSLSGNGIVSLSQGQLASVNAKVFENATQAVEQGSGLDMTRINDIARRALEAGNVSVRSAEGVVTVSHGQVRVTNLATRAEGADLMVTGSLDLKQQTIGARLALSPNDVSQPAAERPVVSVHLSGPFDNPRRTIDVSALTTWLTLRAVERQSKQLEAMEAKRRAAIAEPPAGRAAIGEPPAENPRVPAPAPVAAPAPVITTPLVVAPAAAPPIFAPSSPVAPTLAPPLPPAIEIAPLPHVSEQKPARPPARVQSGAAAQPRPVAPRPLPLLPAGPDN